jgi:soluble lytic murein transglycosylase-like protein
MASLKIVLAVACLTLGIPGHAQPTAVWEPYIIEASERFDVPTAWISAVMQAESRAQTRRNGRPIRSPAGAIGLMQLMPATWADMRKRLALGHDPDNPRDNILAGTLYLRLMYERFGYPGLFAAYNAGPARYADHLRGQRALPAETIGYLHNVLPSAEPSALIVEQHSSWRSVFAVRKDVDAETESAGRALGSSLFVAFSQRQ